MLPPEEKLYDTYNDLFASVKEFAQTQGYTIITRNYTDKGRKFWLECSRGGPTRQVAEADRQRKGSFGLCDCKFLLYDRVKKDSLWHLSVNEGKHNHPAALDIAGHAAARRLTEEQKQVVRKGIKAGSAPRDVFTGLRLNDKDVLAHSHTIYNERDKLRKEELGGLREQKYRFKYQTDAQDRVTHLFFAHTIAIDILHQYPNALLEDCKYKTNRFGVPLLDVVGLTSVYSSFSVCFVFIKNEDKESYNWAQERIAELYTPTERHPSPSATHPLSIATDCDDGLLYSVDEVFPLSKNLLCRWHIYKNLLKNCRKHFDNLEDWEEISKKWSEIVQSATEEGWNQAWTDFKDKYSYIPEAVAYIHKQWIPFETRFVSVWSNLVLHFNNVSISRVEGAYNVIKKYLKALTLDLWDVSRRLEMAIRNVVGELRAPIGSNDFKVWSDHEDGF
ncbi:hypothetical protein PsorP6_016542 [Peronosclerospora sorghi]|uniref:Uncharacterized protein n=1 Tax=Peronosclerospora sorghi TaxID=230839 RepID=A0ACC0VIZ2_9STRA|nr:hypothetical protein PsorP6_016542 [Peronosclerospora sorghi]